MRSWLRRRSGRLGRGWVHSRWGGALAGVLVVVLTSTASVIPVLDHDRPGGPVVDREHDAGQCRWIHDHSICRLTSSSPSRHSGRVAATLWTGSDTRLPPRPPRTLHPAEVRLTYSSRAPPA